MRPNHPTCAALVLLFSVLLGCTETPDDLAPTRRAWVVMGTTLEISVYRSEAESAASLNDLEAAYAAVVEIDQLMSLYREDSEIVLLNAQAGGGPLAVSMHTGNVLSAATHYASISHSALDVTVQPIVDLWGFYDVATAQVPSQGQVDAVLQRVGIDNVTWDSENGQVALAPGAGLDFGGIAKGYAVDRAIAILQDRGVAAGLVNLGGNVGVFGQASQNRPWRIGIRHPRENRLIGQVSLMSGAVSTSGDYDRYFETDGKRYSHIVDPRTGWPVEEIFSLTVVAPNATAADALSTAAFVLGADQGLGLLSRCKGVRGILVQPDAESESLLAVQTDVQRDHPNVQSPSFEVDSKVATKTWPGIATPIADCIWPVKNYRALPY
ncbi:MAG: FAD:protein FMN transferase [Alphaproteobacteria bacterium]|nr:FAD:protein FMN transferase [Alphaproteobacteria bacterium]